MGPNLSNSPVMYTPGTYEISGLTIGPISFNAHVEVFKPNIIDRTKPTVFVAGHAYEKQLGTHPLDQVINKVQELGSILGEKYIVITGYCTGIPSYVSKAALDTKEGQVIGISAFSNSTEHLRAWSNSQIYTETIYKLEPEESASIAIHSGVGVWHRDIFNVHLTNNRRQKVIVAGGHEGTNHEVYVSIANDAIIGMLLGIGGVSDTALDIKAYLSSQNIEHHIVEDTDPKALVQKVEELDNKLENICQDVRTSPTPLIKFLDTVEEKIISSPSPL